MVNTGQEGLDRIRAENFDLILLDLAMPDFSGMDLLLSLKLDGLIKSRNIVIFTASSNQDLLHEIIDIGLNINLTIVNPCPSHMTKTHLSLNV